MINIQKICENSYFEYEFSNMDLDICAQKIWGGYIYGKLWSLEIQALDLKEHTLFPEIPIFF